MSDGGTQTHQANELQKATVNSLTLTAAVNEGCKRPNSAIDVLTLPLPVLGQSAAYASRDEVAVLLQLVQGSLDGLIDGLLNGLTHPFNLVLTAAWLGRKPMRGNTRLLRRGDTCMEPIRSTLHKLCGLFRIR